MTAAFNKGNTPMSDQQPQEPSLSSRFIAGGPGALFGHPKENYDWGSRLSRAFAGLSSDPSSYNQLSKLQEEDGKIVDGPEDMFGNKTKLLQRKGKFYPLQVEGGAPGQVDPYHGFYAPGVSSNNTNLVGEDYLKQFDPTVQAVIRAREEGRTMPTGNTRPGFKRAVDAIATKYGDDIGVPMDDTNYAKRKQYQTQLGLAGPGSVGGQKTLLGTTLGHYAKVADAAVAMHNYDTPVAPLGRAINSVRQLGTDQAAKANYLNEAVDRAAQETGRLYSGSTGGGVHERESTRGRFAGTRTSAELASALEASRDLIHSKLYSLEAQRDEILGPKSGEKIKFIGPEQQKSLDTIEKAIATLRGAKPTSAVTGPSLPKGVKSMTILDQ
jgi:hypothetical protein